MITCVGLGPGDLAYLTQRGRDLVTHAEVVGGFGAVVDLARPLIPPGCQVVPMTYRDQTARLAELAAADRAGRRCVVLFMGDVHFSGFQFLERVDRACGYPAETVPGISSAQVLASRARVCFDETSFVTFHRRGELGPFRRHLVNALRDEHRNAIVIPRPWDLMPRDVAAFLLAAGLPADHPTEVWERLTQPGAEAAWKGPLGACTGEFSDLSIMLIRTLHPMPSQLEPPLPPPPPPAARGAEPAVTAAPAAVRSGPGPAPAAASDPLPSPAPFLP